MAISTDDTFPLWSFGYKVQPTHDKNKTKTSRGRTWEEAWTCIQIINHSFLEPEKVGLVSSVRINDKLEYDRTHPYNWLHDAPLWLKQQEDASDLIW